MITIIAAVAANGVIGDSTRSGMPWFNKEEMDFFKQITMHKNIVMGRKTAEETGILRGRNCLVMSNNPNVNVKDFHPITLQTLLDINTVDPDREFMICGGAEIYKLLIPYANAAIISMMDFVANGDILMPELDGYIKVRNMAKGHLFLADSYINTSPKKAE